MAFENPNCTEMTKHSSLKLVTNCMLDFPLLLTGVWWPSIIIHFFRNINKIHKKFNENTNMKLKSIIIIFFLKCYK